MDGERLSGVQGGDQARVGGAPRGARAPAGPRIRERSGHWHIVGTFRIAGRSVRVRASTGLAATAANRRIVEDEILPAKLAELRNRLLYGLGPSLTWPQAAVGYLRDRANRRRAKGVPGEDREGDYIRWFTAWLKGRGLHLTPAAELTADHLYDFFRERHFERGHAAATVLRTWDPIRAVFNRIGGPPAGFDPADYVEERPADLPVVGKWLHPEEIALHVSCAPKHARPLIAVLWNTGRRLSDLLYCARTAPDYNDPNGTGLCLDPGREHLYLGRTKNGKPRIVWLNDMAAGAIRDWLAGRKDKHDSLFLTRGRAPYKRPRKPRGGQVRKAWMTAKTRAAKIIEEDWGLPERAAVMRRTTPHWARHNMTSHRLAAGESDDQVQHDMGWSSPAMVRRYGWDLAGAGKARANIVQFSDSAAPPEKNPAPAKKIS